MYYLKFFKILCLKHAAPTLLYLHNLKDFIADNSWNNTVLTMLSFQANIISISKLLCSYAHFPPEFYSLLGDYQ